MPLLRSQSLLCGESLCPEWLTLQVFFCVRTTTLAGNNRYVTVQRKRPGLRPTKTTYRTTFKLIPRSCHTVTHYAYIP